MGSEVRSTHGGERQDPSHLTPLVTSEASRSFRSHSFIPPHAACAIHLWRNLPTPPHSAGGSQSTTPGSQHPISRTWRLRSNYSRIRSWEQGGRVAEISRMCPCPWMCGPSTVACLPAPALPWRLVVLDGFPLVPSSATASSAQAHFGRGPANFIFIYRDLQTRSAVASPGMFRPVSSRFVFVLLRVCVTCPLFACAREWASGFLRRRSEAVYAVRAGAEAP